MMKLAAALCVVSAAFCGAIAEENPFAAEVAAFGKIVDIWPEGKMPGATTTHGQSLPPRGLSILAA